MNSWVREVNTEPQLDINPKDAKTRGIDDGDYVRVHNDKGEMVVKAKYNDGIKPGLINTDQGWWDRDYVRGHHNDLTDSEVAEVGRTFAFYDTRVEVELAPDDVDTSNYTGGTRSVRTPRRREVTEYDEVWTRYRSGTVHRLSRMCSDL
ncbi:molybdopterin dinucleotide binding domain-containing protein [Haloarculaceae archaeon H-GB11]|nr:molybdopterin dinucleotide binding domain-containing protein [Haloarculaceae archaeon H-GB11]